MPSGSIEVLTCFMKVIFPCLFQFLPITDLGPVPMQTLHVNLDAVFVQIPPPNIDLGLVPVQILHVHLGPGNITMDIVTSLLFLIQEGFKVIVKV